MRYDVLITNGLVVDPLNKLHAIADVALADGKIAEVGPGLDPFAAASSIDATGKLVTPGFIDPHTHVVRPGSRGSAYKMLLRCGVTTTVDMRGPVSTLLEEIRTLGGGITAGCLNAIFPERDLPALVPNPARTRTRMEQLLDGGALGIKVMGGHYPFSPEAMRCIIDQSAALRAYLAYHCGSTVTDTNIDGLLEAVALAEGRPLHIAHVNSYCRGTVSDVLDECLRGLDALRENPKIVSESYLSVMNGTYCNLDAEGRIESRGTRNCLRMGGYAQDAAGLERAILDGYCVIYAFAGGEMRLLSPDLGHRYWKGNPNAQCTFNVNDPIALVSCATARRGDGSFVVDALCSDGGANPRNVIFRNGSKLAAARYMSLDDLVRKASLNPARMYGLLHKGHLSPGADGDVAVFDPQTGDALYTVTGGKIRMSHGVCTDDPGVALTTERGSAAVRDAGVAPYVVDLEQSQYFRGRSVFRNQ